MAEDQVQEPQVQQPAPVLSEAEQVAKKLEEMRALLADPKTKAAVLKINEDYQAAKAGINRGGRYRKAHPANKALGLDSAADYALLKLLVEEQKTKEELSAAAKKQVKPDSILEHQIIENQRLVEKLLEKAGHPGQFEDDLDGFGIVRLFNQQLAQKNKPELTPTQANTLMILYNPESLSSNFGMIVRSMQDGAPQAEIEADTKRQIDSANSVVALLELNPREFDFTSQVNATISFLKDKRDGQKLVDELQPTHQQGIDAKVTAMQKAINDAALKAVTGKTAKEEPKLEDDKPKIDPTDYAALAAAKLELMNEFVNGDETQKTSTHMNQQYQESIDARYKLIGGAGRVVRLNQSRELRSTKFKDMLRTREDYALLDLLEQKAFIDGWKTSAHENYIESTDDFDNQIAANRKSLMVLAGLNPKESAPIKTEFLEALEAHLGKDNLTPEMLRTVSSLYSRSEAVNADNNYFADKFKTDRRNSDLSLENQQDRRAHVNGLQVDRDTMVKDLEALTALAQAKSKKTIDLEPHTMVFDTFTAHTVLLNSVKVFDRDQDAQAIELAQNQKEAHERVDTKIQSAALIAVGDYNEIAEAKIKSVREETSNRDYQNANSAYQAVKNEKNVIGIITNFLGAGKLLRGINAVGDFFANEPQDKELIFASRKDFELLKLQMEDKAIDNLPLEAHTNANNKMWAFNKQAAENRVALNALVGVTVDKKTPALSTEDFVAALKAKHGDKITDPMLGAAVTMYEDSDTSPNMNRTPRNLHFNHLKSSMINVLQTDTYNYADPDRVSHLKTNLEIDKGYILRDLKELLELDGNKTINPDEMVNKTLNAHIDDTTARHTLWHHSDDAKKELQEKKDLAHAAKHEEMKYVALRQAGEPNAIAQYRKETPLIKKIRNHRLSGPVFNTLSVWAAFAGINFLSSFKNKDQKQTVKTEQVGKNNNTTTVVNTKKTVQFDASKLQDRLDSIKNAGHSTPALQQQQPIKKPTITLPNSTVVTTPVVTNPVKQAPVVVTKPVPVVTAPVTQQKATPIVKPQTGTKQIVVNPIDTSGTHQQKPTVQPVKNAPVVTTKIAKPQTGAKQVVVNPVDTSGTHQQKVVTTSVVKAKTGGKLIATGDTTTNKKLVSVADTAGTQKINLKSLGQINTGDNQQPSATDSLAIKQAILQQKTDSLNANLAKLAAIKTQMTTDSLNAVETKKVEMRNDWVGFAKNNITVTGDKADPNAEITVSRSKLNATLDVLAGDSTFSVKAMKDQFDKQLDDKKDQQKADGTFDRSIFRKEKRQGKAIINAVEKGLEERKLNAKPAVNQSNSDDVYNNGNKQTAVRARPAGNLGSASAAAASRLTQHAAIGSDVSAMFMTNAKDKSSQVGIPELPSGIMGYQAANAEEIVTAKANVAGLSQQYTSTASTSGNQYNSYRYTIS